MLSVSGRKAVENLVPHTDNAWRNGALLRQQRRAIALLLTELLSIGGASSQRVRENHFWSTSWISHGTPCCGRFPDRICNILKVNDGIKHSTNLTNRLGAVIMKWNDITKVSKTFTGRKKEKQQRSKVVGEARWDHDIPFVQPKRPFSIPQT